MRKIQFILFGAWLITACQQEVSITEESNDCQSIYLSAMVESNAKSRAPYLYTAPNSTEPDGKLYTTVLASSTKQAFTHVSGSDGTDNGVVAIHTQANFDNNTPQLLKDAVYPKSGTPVYFIGLHPQTRWEVNNGGTQAAITIDGSQDVMFAPRIEGTYAQDNTLNSQVLPFKHLLTWLKINIKAEDETTIAAWGKITNMKITSKDKVMIDLGAEYSNLNCVSYSYADNNNTLLPVRYIENDNVFPGANGYSMKQSFDKVAYVLCTPVEATEKTVVDGVDVTTAEYTLHIETEKRKIELPIDLKKNNDTYFTGNTRSRHFTLNLTFKMGNTIVITATLEVTDWKYGGMTDEDVSI